MRGVPSAPDPTGSSLFEVLLAVDLDPEVPGLETVGACLPELTHETFESIAPLGLENPTCGFLDSRRVLSSAGMTFLLE